MIGVAKTNYHVSFPLLGAVRRNALLVRRKASIRTISWSLSLVPIGSGFLADLFRIEVMLTSLSSVEGFLY